MIAPPRPIRPGAPAPGRGLAALSALAAASAWIDPDPGRALALGRLARLLVPSAPTKTPTTHTQGARHV